MLSNWFSHNFNQRNKLYNSKYNKNCYYTRVKPIINYNCIIQKINFILVNIPEILIIWEEIQIV